MENDIKKTEQEIKKKPFFKKILRFLKYSLVTFITLFLILIIAFYLIISFYDPKAFIEKQLRATLNTDLSIESVHINPFTGLKIGKVIINDKEGDVLFSLKRLILDYDLFKLFNGEFVVNEILVDSPKAFLKINDGKSNLDDLILNTEKKVVSKEKKKEEETLKKDVKPLEIKIPNIPIKVDLNKLLIKSIAARVIIDGEKDISVDGLNIQVNLKADSDKFNFNIRFFSKEKIKNLKVKLQGSENILIESFFLPDIKIYTKDLNNFSVFLNLVLKDIFLDLNGKKQTVSLNISSDITASLKDEKIDVKNLTVDIGNKSNININAVIEQFLSLRKFSFNIDNTVLSLDELILLAKPFLVNFPVAELSGDIKIPKINISGVLNNEIKPVNINGDVKISGLNIDLPDFKTKISNLDVLVSNIAVNTENFKPNSIDIDILIKAKNIKNNNIEIHSFSKELKISSKGSVFKNNSLKFTVKSDFLFKDKAVGDVFGNILSSGNFNISINDLNKGEIKVSGLLSLDKLDVSVPKLKAGVSGLKVDIPINDLKLSNFMPKDIKSDIKIWIRSANYEDMYVHDFKNSIKVFVHGKKFEKNDIALTLNTKLLLQGEENLKKSVKAFLNLRVKSDIKKGDFDLIVFNFNILNYKKIELLNFDMNSRVLNFGNKSLNVVADTINVDIAPLLDVLPPKYLTVIKGVDVSGAIGLKLKMSGKLPKDKEIENLKLPINLNVILNTKDINLNYKPQNIQIEHLNTGVSLSYSDFNLKVGGKIGVDKVKKDGLPVSDITNTLLLFEYAFTDLDRLNITNKISVESLGFSHDLSGKMYGLLPIIKRVKLKENISLDAIFNKVTLDLKSSLTLDTKNLNGIVEKLDTNGIINSNLFVSLVPKNTVSVLGDAGFSNLNISLDKKINVNGQNGKIPFKKTLFLTDKVDLITPFNFRSNDKQISILDIDLLGKGNEDKFFIKNINMGKIDVNNLDFPVKFNENKLSVKDFLVDIFDGSIGGSIYLDFSEDEQAIGFSVNFAGINLNKLLPDLKGINDADSKVFGNLNFALKFINIEEGINLDNLNLNLNITKIEDKALDRLLLFLDPKESKPAIVSARAQLSLAKPHLVHVKIKNGLISFKILLKTNVLGVTIINQVPDLGRMPFASLINFAMIQDSLKDLKGVGEILKLIGANRLKFDKNGKVKISY